MVVTKSKSIAVVLICMDYRFWPQALVLLRKRYGDFDLVAMAGASKNITAPEHPSIRRWVFDNVKLSQKLHHANRMILTNHTDCGAYGGSKKFASMEDEIKMHQGELRKAKQILAKKFPKLKVETVLLTRNKSKQVSIYGK